MHFDLSIPSQLIAALTPDIVVMVGATVLMLWAAWGPESDERQRAVGLGAIGVCVIAIASIIYFMANGATASAGVIAIDNFRWIADIVFLLATIATIALAIDGNTKDGTTAAELHVLTVFATSGMMILASARDLIVIFLGIEIMSIAVYVLAGINRRSAKSAEAALKYFLLGAFATGFLLYGMALTYGATGSTNLTDIGARVVEMQLAQNPMMLIGIGLMLVGFGFKIAAVPFHMWAPDVYEGSPAPITAYMAAAVKGAAFVALLRVFYEAFSQSFHTWHGAIWWLAAITMLVGNLIALAQKNIKRMLAYSSIAHAGYMLVALTVLGPGGSTAFLFYILAYTLATFGAFGVVSAIAGRNDESSDIASFAGLWNVRPGMAVAMAVFMLALLGFPVFGGVGFLAKWYIVKAALEAAAPQTRLAVVLVLTSVISAGYYLYVVMVMFMKPRPENAPEPAATGFPTRCVVGVAAVLILALGLYPNALDRILHLEGAALTVPERVEAASVPPPIPRP